MWQRALARPAQILAAILVMGCLAAMVALGLIARQTLLRQRTIRQRIEHTNRIQHLALSVQRSLAAQSSGARQSMDPEVVHALRDEVAELRALKSALHPRTNDRLTRLQSMLTHEQKIGSGRYDKAFSLVKDIVDAETRAQSATWARMERDSRRELHLILIILAVLPIVAALIYWTVRHRILAPLNDLQRLLSRLAQGRFTTIEVGDIQQVLRPLFVNFNRLVTRLEELEAEHQNRAQSLEREVRAATEALLEQQASLSRAERLAAVGETTASLAHELRNPLAGILMSLGNLRRESVGDDVSQRLDLVIAEVERLTRMLNMALSAARHSPERPQRLNLHALVENLLALLRYQIPENISLACDISNDLECLLPKEQVRQALLNLIINSVRALDRSEGEIVVASKRSDGNIEIAVYDNGPGFSPELLSGIQAFKTRSAGGTGLGLAMVRRAVADLGGEVHLQNRAPHGACVRLVLPCHG